jgi:predicted metalloprotease with PDZ domain
VNVAESYYRRGALLGLALDLTLRRATGGRRGLDEVFRRLFRTYAAKGRGYPPGAFEDAAVRVALSRPARLVVAEVLDGGPAQRAGVNAGDVLVAFDARRADEELIARLEKERKPGSAVKVTVFRRAILETYRVRLGWRRASVWRIEALPDAPTGARRLKKSWLKTRVSV